MSTNKRTLKLSKDEILQSIKEIIDDKEVMNKRQLEFKWNNFMNTYPMIFFQLVDSDSSRIDLSLVESMVDDVNCIDDGTKTNEEVELDIGNELAERFVYTKVNRPSPKELINAYKKMVDDKYSSTTNKTK